MDPAYVWQILKMKGKTKMDNVEILKLMNECLNEAKETCKNDSEFLDFVIAKAAEHGSVITKDDINAALVSNIPVDKELSDNQLKNIAGGRDSWCAVNDACYLAFLHHSDTVEDEACYVDYVCAVVINASPTKVCAANMY